jgi:hypothetical protein
MIMNSKLGRVDEVVVVISFNVLRHLAEQIQGNN